MKKQLYKIKTDKGEIKEVEGSPIVVEDWLQTFVHRGLTKDTYAWVICELTTGLKINGGDTQKKAIINTKFSLEKHGKDTTLKDISDNEKIN